MGNAPIAGTASQAPPGGASLPGAAAVAQPAWGALSNGVAKLPNFASDLAHLMSLLTQGRYEMPDAELPARGESSSPESAAATVDTVSSLWAELGLALSSREPAMPVAGISRHAEVETTTPGAAAATSSPATGSAASPTASGDMPVAGSAREMRAAALPAGVERVPAKDAAAVSADAIVQTSADDAATPASTPHLASLAAFAPAEPARPGTAAVAVAQAVVDLRQPQAPQEIAERVAWHVGKGVSEVQIRLNPEDLGPLEIKLRMDGDKVSVRFDTADSSVRDVVQASLPTLSSLLSARGLQLDQAQVFSQNRGHGTPQQTPHSPSTSSSPVADNTDDMSLGSIARPIVRRGLLDDYA